LILRRQRTAARKNTKKISGAILIALTLTELSKAADKKLNVVSEGQLNRKAA
jgi:hypothetical protein